MSNEFYNHGSWPQYGQTGDSASARNELDAITAGFSKLPALAGLGKYHVIVNQAGNALVAALSVLAVAGVDTITATSTPTLTAYLANEFYQFKAAGANTGAATLNVDGIGALNLLRPDGSALQAGDIYGVNYVCNVYIRGSDAILLNPYNGITAPVHAASNKAIPVGADEILILDSATGFTLKKTTLTAAITSIAQIPAGAWKITQLLYGAL